jgi:hypothetical protein
MTVSILGRNVPEAYTEGLNALRIFGKEEMTRLGPVISIPEMTEIRIEYPDERVLFDPIRRANPFFHAMEFVWMMAGSDNANWISQYNSRMLDFADEGIINGAYGRRWRRHFGLDQIAHVIRILKEDPNTRRALIAMWDPSTDMTKGWHDYPCNTHIAFRRGEANVLNMTVFNRSNDFIWGALGANAVHMTMLHELVARAVGMHLGVYRVLSNNLHIYKSLENFDDLWRTIHTPNPYYTGTDNAVTVRPLLAPNEPWEKLISDCERAVDTSVGFHSNFESSWMRDVAVPIHFAYLDRIQKVGDGMRFVKEIKADDWRLACQKWIDWKIAPPTE